MFTPALRGLLAAAVLAIGMFAGARALDAAVVAHFTLEDLCAKADIIAHATVTSSSSAWDEPRKKIYTTYKLDVKAQLKGAFDGEAQCQARGGSAEGKGMQVGGEAYLVDEGEYVLFMEKHANGRLHMLGLAQGRFKVTREEGQPAMAKNTVTGMRVVQKDGNALEAEKVQPISDTLEGLKARITALVTPKPVEAPKPPAQPQPQPEDGALPPEAARPDAPPAGKIQPANGTKQEGGADE